MRGILILLALVSCSPSPPPEASRPDRKLTRDGMTEFLIGAIFEGLVEDWPDAALLQPILEKRAVHFVPRCLICTRVFDGMSAYVHLRSTTSSTHEVRFPKELSDGLMDPDRAVRLKAIDALVDRYVARHFERVDLTPGEKKSMKNGLMMDRKYGMTVKPEEFGDYCPSCSGANKR
jgi:hypothetical protein